MPIYLKDLKKRLQADANKVGKKPNGDWKYTPPRIISRKLDEYPDLPVGKVQMLPRPSLKYLSVIGLCKSETNPSKSYKVIIHCHDTEFKDEETGNYTNKTSYKDRKGRRVIKYHKNISVKNNRFSFSCNCLDFHHRFNYELADVDSLVGNRHSGYERVTPAWPLGEPNVNSTEKVGICKHLNSLLNYLYKKKIVREV